MDNPRPEKVAVVAEVRDKLDGAEAVVLTEYRGLGVTDMAALRSALRDAGGEYKVYKNTMVRFAAKELDLDIQELLIGPTAIAFTGTRPDGTPGDAVTVTKALTEFGKTNEHLIIKGGLLEGRRLSMDEISALSKIAPREELLARLAGGMAAPMQQFASLLKAVPQNLAYALAALIEKGGAPGAPESAPPAEEAAAEADQPPAEDAAAEADQPPAEDAAAEADEPPVEESPAEADESAAEDAAAEADESAAEDTPEAEAETPAEDSAEPDAVETEEDQDSGDASEDQDPGDASEDKES